VEPDGHQSSAGRGAGAQRLGRPEPAEEQEDRFPALAAELAALNVDVIVGETAPTIAAAKRATATIPIVMAYAADPVGLGFVDSLNASAWTSSARRSPAGRGWPW
jgi:hypothetical protein